MKPLLKYWLLKKGSVSVEAKIGPRGDIRGMQMNKDADSH